MNPRTDLCNTCHKFRNDLHSCQNEVTKSATKKIKLIKLGAKGTEEPLFCQHEHCKWWQLKHYLIKEKTKQKTIKELNKIYKNKQEEAEESD